MSAQTNLKQPNQIDWDNYNPGSKYSPPPPAIGPDGKPITYYGKVKAKFEESDFDATAEGDRSYQIGPVQIVKSGAADGTQIKFVYASTKQFQRNGKPINANSVGNFLKACAVQAKPQSIQEYDAAVKATVGRIFPFVLDWEARNKDTGETIKGYRAFPEDPARPGQRKAVLTRGDVYYLLGPKGEVIGQQTVESEVLFANPRVRYFVDPAKR